MGKYLLIIFVWFAATFNNLDQLANFMNNKGLGPQSGAYYITDNSGGVFNLVYWTP